MISFKSIKWTPANTILLLVILAFLRKVIQSQFLIFNERESIIATLKFN
ncbi:hypothetical protein C8D97_101181 [Pleionea mediterranea]|uniref:Uncharacterized protein n=1 Tax=Pleionea mediterranea TaxID=523701 RepID=A0A316G148_9GAMM|nr:hypothetical protein C8D97_101181 [Pleionea mediterranea]